MSSSSKTSDASRVPSARDRALSGQIFSVSAGLVGVCLTVVGLFRLFRQVGRVAGIADNLIALNAVVFLAACMCAYLAIRTENEVTWRRLERLADVLFLFGLTTMTATGALIAYELI